MRVKIFQPIRNLTDHAFKNDRIDAIAGWCDRNISMRLQGIKRSKGTFAP